MRTHSKFLMLGLTALCGVMPARAEAQIPSIVWGPAPAVFPAGARMAVLQGDPGKPVPFTVRLSFPNGYTIAPHYHPTDEAVTVISGRFQLGMGDQMDPKQMTTLGPGGFAIAAMNQHHYARARGRTVVQVQAMGPFALTYVNPADDPSKK